MSADERVHLAGRPMLVGMAFALGGLLAAVLPTRREYAEGADAPSPDAYSLAYLAVLTRASPGDLGLRLTYVRHLATLGEYEAAVAALGPALEDPTSSADAKNLRFDLMLAHARSVPEGSSARAEEFSAVGRELESLRRVPQTATRLRSLATVALELEKPALAADYLLERATLLPVKERAAGLAEAGTWLRAANDGMRAADCFQQAALLEGDPALARGYVLAAIDALEAEDHVAEAADLAASSSATYSSDVAMLERATRLAGHANRAEVARDLGRRLLALRPDDEMELQSQVHRELAADDPRAALPLVERMLALHPEDARWHEVLAHVAEWAGNPSLALDNWLWLLGRGISPSTTFVVP